MLKKYSASLRLGFNKSRAQGFKRLLLSGLILVFIAPSSGWAGEPGAFTNEQKEVERAARQYLDAEVNRDYKAVFASLYPASEYRQANDFDFYLAEAQSSPVGIDSYKILRITILGENPDKEKLKMIESFARVEVDVTIGYRDTGQKSLVNYDFPFVKEGGRWYKL